MGYMEKDLEKKKGGKGYRYWDGGLTSFIKFFTVASRTSLIVVKGTWSSAFIGPVIKAVVKAVNTSSGFGRIFSRGGNWFAGCGVIGSPLSS